MMVPISDVVLDFDLYSRSSVDRQHVRRISRALRDGAKLPPVVIDKESRRVVDGFHRVEAYRGVHGEGCFIPAVEKEYETERELLLDSMRLNAKRG